MGGAGLARRGHQFGNGWQTEINPWLNIRSAAVWPCWAGSFSVYGTEHSGEVAKVLWHS
jgi:hypothetical protein